MAPMLWFTRSVRLVKSGGPFMEVHLGVLVGYRVRSDSVKGSDRRGPWNDMDPGAEKGPALL